MDHKCKGELEKYVAHVAELLTINGIVKDEQSIKDSYFIIQAYLKLALEECAKLTAALGVGVILTGMRCAETAFTFA